MINDLFRWKFILPYLQRFRWQILAGILLVVLSTALDQVTPWMLKNIMDTLNCAEQARHSTAMETHCSQWLEANPKWQTKSSTSLLLPYLLLILAATLLSSVFLYFQRWWVITASRKLEYQLRNDFFVELQKQSKSFFDKTPLGDLMSNLTNDLDRIRDFMGPVILHLTRMVSLTVFTLVALLLLSPTLALVGLVPVLILPFFVNRFMRVMHRLYSKLQGQLGSLNSYVQDSLAGIQVIKSYGAHKTFLTKFEHSSDSLKKTSQRVAIITAGLWPLIGVLGSIGILLAVWIGSRLVIQGSLTLGALTAALIYLLKLQFPLAGLGWVTNLYQRSNAALDRLMNLKNRFEPPPPLSFTLLSMENSLDSLRFQNLNFGYNPEKNVLKNIQLDLTPGSSLGITGPTGSGKTALLHVLCGVYRPPKQQLFLNDKPREYFSDEQWRRYFSLAPQDGFLFSTTIGENIKLGSTKATNLRMEEAGDLGGFARDLAQIPGGYHALLGERGINLSGGQKQRVGLSRALMAGAQVLCLDDTLSALDAETESEVLKNLKNLLSGKTLVLVSHRFSAISHCDEILYLKDGEIVERGTHLELVQKSGEYARVYYKQTLKEKLEQV